jgi:hypothetical protein
LLNLIASKLTVATKPFLAMAYLYNGNDDKAMAMYAQYKNEKDSEGKTGKEIFLADLAEVAAAVPAKNPLLPRQWSIDPADGFRQMTIGRVYLPLPRCFL